LELAARHPGLPIGLHLAPDISKRLALDIVAPDRDDRHLVGEAAEQITHAVARRFADNIPHRAVDAGNCFQERLAVAISEGEREELRPYALGFEDIVALDQRPE